MPKGPDLGVARSYRELSKDEDRRAVSLMRSSLVIDTIGSSLIKPEPPIIEGRSYIDRALAAGVNVLGVTLAAHADTFEVFLDNAAANFDLLAARPDTTLQVETLADIERARSSGRLGIIFGLQSGALVGTEMSRWTILHKIGVRLAQLTYNERNQLGDGCMEPEDRGLTSYGRQSIQEMQRLGICLDLSHAGTRTALDATAFSSKPVVYSHANPKAVGPGKRNLTDEQMKEMAKTGGVMGISPHSMLCHKKAGVRPTVDDMMDMFDYAIDLIGIDHVAVGSDVFESFTKLSWETTTKRWYPSGFVWETMAAEGFSSIAEWPNVVRGLVARGYSDEDIAKVIGGNWLRVFGQVWAA
ncbi:MAG TPA: membrane dipeptidase [Candidatus Limnocylindria bacterium]|nr:membrane dipeptidase [Candidatus Limnocylindria bacterium]